MTGWHAEQASNIGRDRNLSTPLGKQQLWSRAACMPGLAGGKHAARQGPAQLWQRNRDAIRAASQEHEGIGSKHSVSVVHARITRVGVALAGGSPGLVHQQLHAVYGQPPPLEPAKQHPQHQQQSSCINGRQWGLYSGGTREWGWCNVLPAIPVHVQR